MSLRLLVAVACFLGAFLCGCEGDTRGPAVTVYTSVDKPHSAPIFQRFTETTGIRVEAVYDTEASKTVGLFNRLLAEKDFPKADVFWNSEIVRTIMLKRKGVTEPYRSTSAKDIPPDFVDTLGDWTGFAARGRVLLWNTNLVQKPPASIAGFAEVEWKGRFAMANPLFGTTGTHVGAWFAKWGPERAARLLASLKANAVIITSGNGSARDMVASGEAPACATDTDDAWGAIFNGRPVQMTFPDQGPNEDGVVLIPNTVCLLKGAPHRESAERFIDFLLSPEVEEMLAFSESAQIPLRSNVKRPPHVKRLEDLKVMKVDWEKVADVMEESAKYIQEEFLK